MEVYRINKVLRELNISLETAVTFLLSQGHNIESNPNTKITISQYEILLRNFHRNYKSQKQSDSEIIHEKLKNTEPEKFVITTEYTLGRLRRIKGIPKSVFKFFSITEHNLNALTDRYIYLPHFSKFNDPFDCNFRLIDFKKQNKKSNQKKRERILFENFENIGISCFSRKNDSILMWSHYAENHKGFCIEFHTNINTTGINPLDINYIKDFQNVNYYKNKKDALYHMLYSKSLEWEYEEELRLIKTNIEKDEDRRLYYSDEDIKAIYFGVNTDIKVIERVIEIINTKFSPLLINEEKVLSRIRFFKGKVSENAFQIVWEEVNSEESKLVLD